MDRLRATEFQFPLLGSLTPERETFIDIKTAGAGWEQRASGDDPLRVPLPPRRTRGHEHSGTGVPHSQEHAFP